MRKNTKKNREKLAEEEVSKMDFDAMEEYIQDQFKEYYEMLSHKEFNEQWNSAFGK